MKIQILKLDIDAEIAMVERDLLRDSNDYTKGWQACINSTKQHLTTIDLNELERIAEERYPETNTNALLNKTRRGAYLQCIEDLKEMLNG